MFVNKASQYGLYAVTLMARDREARVTAAQVARTFHISENHVAKVLQQLARARIVRSTRGAAGGYRLVRDPERLTMLDVVSALEGPPPDPCAGCELRHEDDCTPHFAACGVRGVLGELQRKAYETLRTVTIASLVRRGLDEAGGETLAETG